MDSGQTKRDAGHNPFGEDHDESAPIRRMRYQEMFEFAPEAQFVTDAHGLIREANHAAAVLLNCPKEFLTGKPLALFGVEGERRRFYDSLRLFREGSTADAFELGLVRRGGGVRQVLMLGRTGDWRGSDPVHHTLLWVVRDVTEQREAEAARGTLQRQLSTAEENERRRLSRDLHDQLGQTVTALALGLQAVRASGALPHAALERLTRVQQLVDELGRQVLDIAARLRPTVLDDLGLEPALRQLIADWSNRTGVAADFHVAGLVAERFSPAAETTLYRVVQEALTNVARHSRARRVGVVVARREGHGVAVVEDDGCGFDPDAVSPTASGQLGLIGMRERVALVGGTMEIESRPGGGTTVYARIPLEKTGAPRAP